MTKYVGDNIKVLMTALAASVTNPSSFNMNIPEMERTGVIRHQNKNVTNIEMKLFQTICFSRRPAV